MKAIYKTKRNVMPQVLSTATSPTKICSIGDVCKGKPLPNNRSHFYANCSACIACTAKKSKEKWAEKQKDKEIYF